MKRDIYYSWTLPWHDHESLLGFTFVKQSAFKITDNDTGEEVQGKGIIFSIGLILIRIDIVL